MRKEKPKNGGYHDDPSVHNFSKISMYLRCPLQYYFRYVKGIKNPPKSALTLGRAFHAATAVNYRQKIETRKDMKLGDVLEAFADSFDVLKPETEWEKDESAGEVKDMGIACVNAYQAKVAPTVQPALVEQEFTVEFENLSRPFKGTLDVACVKRYIHDSKTAKSKPADGAIKRDLQTTGYALGYRMLTGNAEAGVVLDTAVKYKSKDPEIFTQIDRRTKADIDAFLRMLGKVDFAIQNELFWPNPHNYMCSESGCGYWRFCKAGRKVKI